MKKHVNTKHPEKNGKICSETSKIPMEGIWHTAKNHGSNTKENTSLIRTPDLRKYYEKRDSNNNKLSDCTKCGNKIDMKEYNICQFSRMIKEYC